MLSLIKGGKENKTEQPTPEVQEVLRGKIRKANVAREYCKFKT